VAHSAEGGALCFLTACREGAALLGALPPRAVDLTGRERQPDPWQPAWIREKYFGE